MCSIYFGNLTKYVGMCQKIRYNYDVCRAIYLDAALWIFKYPIFVLGLQDIYGSLFLLMSLYFVFVFDLKYEWVGNELSWVFVNPCLLRLLLVSWGNNVILSAKTFFEEICLYLLIKNVVMVSIRQTEDTKIKNWINVILLMIFVQKF